MNQRLMTALGLLMLGGASNAVLRADPPTSAQPAKVQASTLAATRQVEDSCITLGIQFVTVPDELWAKRNKLDDAAAALTKRGKTAFLSDVEMSSLLMALLADKRTGFERAPTLSLLTGQSATVSTMEKLFFLTGLEMVFVGEQSFLVPQNRPYDVGLKVSATPSVSSDRRAIRVDLKAQRIRVDADLQLIPVEIPLPQSFEEEKGQPAKIESVKFKMFFQQPRFAKQDVEQKLLIPIDKTAVIFAGNEMQSVKKIKASIASLIPFGDELFGEPYYQRERRTVLLLVQPRLHASSSPGVEVLGTNSLRVRPPYRESSEQSEER